MRKEIDINAHEARRDLGVINKAWLYERKPDDPHIPPSINFALRFNMDALTKLIKQLDDARDKHMTGRGAVKTPTGWSFPTPGLDGPAARSEAQKRANEALLSFNEVESEYQTLTLYVVDWEDAQACPFPQGWLPLWMVSLPEEFEETKEDEPASAARTNGKTHTRKRQKQ